MGYKYLADYDPPQYLIPKVHLKVFIYDAWTEVHGILEIHPQLQKKPLKNLVLDGVNLELKKVILNGELLSSEFYEKDSTQLTIKKTLQEPFFLETQVCIRPKEQLSKDGFYQTGKLLITQCEAENFRKITYFLDRPDIMSQYEVYMEADQKEYPVLLSNGNPGESFQLGDRHAQIWYDPFFKPSYLFAMVAGPLDTMGENHITPNGKAVELKFYTERQQSKWCYFALEALKTAIDWEEKIYKKSPDLESYKIVTAHDFNFGAMENKGLNIFNTRYLICDPEFSTDAFYRNVVRIIAHEYFHNWTGNRVTCRDWFQLCLKEGLTVFREEQFMADLYEAGIEDVKRSENMFTELLKEERQPGVPPSRSFRYMAPDNLYTSITYEKSAAIIRMMYLHMGKERFYKGMENYFHEGDGRGLTQEDFMEYMGDWTLWPWFIQSGMPHVKIHAIWEDNHLKITCCQEVPHAGIQAPLPIPMDFEVFSESGKKLKLSPMDLNSQWAHKIATDENERVVQILWLKQREETFRFYTEEQTNSPILSFFRNGYAPVTWESHQSEEDLMNVLDKETAPGACWRISQKIWKTLLLHGAEKTSWSYQALEIILNKTKKANEENCRGITYALWSWPKQETLVQDCDPIPLEKLEQAYTKLEKFLLKHWHKEIIDLYEKNSPRTHDFDFIAAEQRRLRFSLLKILRHSQEGSDILQNYKIQNMTEERMILTLAAEAEDHWGHKYLQKFYEKWIDHPFLLEFWFQAQVEPPKFSTHEKVTELLKNPKFSWSSPDHIRHIIGGFSSNLVGFHEPKGKGYEVVIKAIETIDAMNPTMSSYLLKTFGSWRRCDESRKEKILAHLQNLSSKNLSSSSQEVLNSLLL